MSEKEFLATLKELGWATGKDDIGDRYSIFHLDDRQVQAFPTVRKRSGHLLVSLPASVSTRELTEIESHIYGNPFRQAPIDSNDNLAEKEVLRLRREDFVELSDNVLAWARSRDLDQGLRVYRELPTDAKGIYPLHHLASLALHGDVDQLSAYQRSFEQGDRLGFVPYITKDMIDRAVELSKSKAGMT